MVEQGGPAEFPAAPPHTADAAGNRQKDRRRCGTPAVFLRERKKRGGGKMKNEKWKSDLSEHVSVLLKKEYRPRLKRT